MEEPAAKIRACIAEVEELRAEAERQPELANAVSAIKRLQARRFASTYADLLKAKSYGPAARFFLEELYGDESYAERDAQFSRIAGAIQRLLPQDAVQTAVSLAKLHVLSEQLDHAMAQAWRNTSTADDEYLRYLQAWRYVGNRAGRQTQLRVVLEIGEELRRLTHTPGLRVMLRLMHPAAYAAGLGTLQRFLESGFDTFAKLEKQRPGALEFLATVRERETLLIDGLFGPDISTSRALLPKSLLDS